MTGEDPAAAGRHDMAAARTDLMTVLDSVLDQLDDLRAAVADQGETIRAQQAQIDQLRRRGAGR